MTTTEDQIKEKYLERAIRELNSLTHELQDCRECPRGNLMPVLGSGKIDFVTVTKIARGELHEASLKAA